MTKKKIVFSNNPLLSGPAMEERTRSGIPYRELQLSAIDTDPNQPRINFDEERLSELAHSIKTYGVLSPILVKPGKSAGRFMLISGERRLRAARLAGRDSIPVLINQDEDTSGSRTLAMQLVENLQRADLSPLERAHAIAALKETSKLSIREVGDKLGISKSMVQRSLDILNLPADLLNALKEGASESKILLLSKIDDEEIRASYLKDLDVLTRSRLKKDIDVKESRNKAGKATTAEDERISDELRRVLGVKVVLQRSAPDSERGKLTIEFYSSDDLQDIFRRLVAA